jgi:hypothetical protein
LLRETDKRKLSIDGEVVKDSTEGITTAVESTGRRRRRNTGLTKCHIVSTGKKLLHPGAENERDKYQRYKRNKSLL